MKVRMDFVTNSSSSSFIIALRKDENGEYTEAVKKTVMEWFDSICGDTAHNEEELKELLYYEEVDDNEYQAMGEWAKEDYDDKKEQLNSLKNHISNGYTIRSGRVEFDSDQYAYKLEALCQQLTT